MTVQPKKNPLIPAALLALPLAVAAAAWSPPAAAATILRELADDVYMLSGDGYTSLAVVTTDGVLITDPAFPQRARMLKKAIASVTDQPVTWIVLSHEHYDHVGGTEIFADAKVICHVSCESVFALDILGNAPKKVDIRYDNSEVFDFGGKTVHLHHIGPADGIASTIVHLPEQDIAYTADLYHPGALTPGVWMEDVNYLAVLHALKKMQEMDLRHAVNAHTDSTAIRDIDESIAFIEALFVLVSTEINKELGAGGPRAVIENMERWTHELALPKYADWEGYEEHMPTHIRRMALAIFHGG